MRVLKGDIFGYATGVSGSGIVIPTNEGWNSRGENIMGAGLAKIAAEMEPALPKLYGMHLKREFDKCGKDESSIYFYDTNIFLNDATKTKWICLPTKRLNKLEPSLSWQCKSSLPLIKSKLYELYTVSGTFPIFLPLLGCGLGQLPVESVLATMAEVLVSDRFHLVVR